MIKKLCIYPNCNDLAIENKCNCEKHFIEKKKNKKPFKNQRRSNTKLYNTTRWRELRKKVLEYMPNCLWCNAQTNLTVDHIIQPRGNEALFFDFNNLQTLCKSCHRIKTAKEIQERKNKKFNTN